MKRILQLFFLLLFFQLILIHQAQAAVDFKDYTPAGNFIKSGSYRISHHGPIAKGGLRLSPYIPTGLERGEVHNELMKSTIALNKICETESSPYYEVLEYKTIEHTQRLANGNSIVSPQFWANLKNVGNPECTGWFFAKRATADGTHDVMFTKTYSGNQASDGNACPLGWKVGQTAFQKSDGTSRPADVYKDTFECFAPIGAPIPKDFFCKGYAYGGYQQLADIHKRAQDSGVLACNFGREPFDKEKMDEAELRLNLQKNATTIAPSVATPSYKNCTTKFYQCESSCKKQMISGYCIGKCAERYCETENK